MLAAMRQTVKSINWIIQHVEMLRRLSLLPVVWQGTVVTVCKSSKGINTFAKYSIYGFNFTSDSHISFLFLIYVEG